LLVALIVICTSDQIKQQFLIVKEIDMNSIPAETDVIVIGSGAAGLAAALTAAEGGARVIVFEKERSLGGSSNFFKGTFAVESEMQRAKYVTYSRDQAFRNFMEYSHWKANALLVRSFVDESAGTIKWLQQRGVEFRDVMINMPEAPITYHVVKGLGEALVKSLVTRAKEKGVIIRSSTPVKNIIRENGRIRGVIAEEEGEEIRFTSRAIIIATGGYLNNKEWVKKYCGFDLGVNLFPVGNVDKMGDGIRMAWEMGAAEEGMGVLETLRVGPVGNDFSTSPLEFVAVQPDLWVDSQGERFCDECIGHYDSSSGNANARFKIGYTFSLFDDSIIERLKEIGIDRNISILNMPGTRLIGFDEALQAAVKNGSKEVYTGDSVEELAEKIGVNALTLRATIDQYNQFCAKGHDDLFAKDPKYLRPLKGSKFYAVKARTVCLGSLGGIKINQRTEVLDKNNKVIPGLYAGGYDAGGLYGDSYAIQAGSGASSAFALNSGRIAGINALKYLNK
jgi:fumarate reductase flavoprotein subunit